MPPFPSPTIRLICSSPRQAIRPSIPLTRVSPYITPFYRPEQRNMATSSASAPAPAVQEWLIIAPDFKGAIEKRLKVRPDHLKGLKADEAGFWLFGGATLDEPISAGTTPKFNGSVMLIGAPSREDVIERLKKDIYVTGEVWEWDKIQIIPFKRAISKELVGGAL